MLSGNLLLIRLAAIWLLLGVPPWFIDMVFTGIIWPIAILTHVGGAAMGLVALRQVRMARGVSAGRNSIMRAATPLTWAAATEVPVDI